MNWKISVGGILIFVGIAQFLKLFSDYKYNNTFAMLIGLGFTFVGVVILGVYLVRQGRRENKNNF
jgi:hypothetical protein